MNLKDLAKRAEIHSRKRPIRLFIIRNGRFHAEYMNIKNRFIHIANRAVSTLIKTQGIGDMFRIYAVAKKNHMEFNLASIPPSFTKESKAVFDKEYMDALFKFGYDKAIQGYDWQHKPPYMDQGDVK